MVVRDVASLIIRLTRQEDWEAELVDLAGQRRWRPGGRRPKLKTHQQQEIVRLVNSGQKTAADVARLFNVHPATVSLLRRRDKAP